MAIIGMGEVGRRMGINPNSARRALQNAGVKLIAVTGNAYAIEERDLQKFLAKREGYAGRGRPKGKK